jgi:2-amino-4-hydroxy-6-hydroxymethyldihydropteridine diphosphokinase
MALAYLGLGSNLGDRRARIDAALAALRAHPAVRAVVASDLIETDPVGGPPGQGRYLNAAARIETDLAPRDLLALLKRIEHDLGRAAGGPRWGPRPIDLDLLLYDDLCLQTGDLTVPHPRFRERRFVLKPLAQVAPDARDPVTGLTVRQLLARLDAGA